jgi:hypothetical protein
VDVAPPIHHQNQVLELPSNLSGAAAITQVYWGGLIATDAVVARLFPFIWQPLFLWPLGFTKGFGWLLAPSVIIGWLDMRQRGTVLEQISPDLL